MNNLKKIVFSFLIICVFLPSLSARKHIFFKHDFHTSLTEMRFNKATNALEITIRVFTDDFEEALKVNFGKEKIELNTPAADGLIEQYIKRKFAFLKEKDVVFCEYLGKEVDTDATWLYLELKNPEKIKGFSILNNLFFELFDDQNNVINIIYPDKKKTILFNKQIKTHQYPF